MFEPTENELNVQKAQVELQPSALKRYKVISSNHARANVKTGQTLVFTLKVQNDTEKAVWDDEDSCIIKCIKPAECNHFSQKLTALTNFQQCILTFEAYIPLNAIKQTLELEFAFMTVGKNDEKKFGKNFKITFDVELALKDVRMSKQINKGILREPTQYDKDGNKLSNIRKETRSVNFVTEEGLYNLAFKLSDEEGLGSFDTCYAKLIECKGDPNLTRRYLLREIT